MEPLIHSVTTTVAQDVRKLVRATQLETPLLLEKDPPNWRWHLPLGFVSLAAAGTLLIAAGGVHWRVQEHWRMQEQRHVASYRKTNMHKQKVRPQPNLPRG